MNFENNLQLLQNALNTMYSNADYSLKSQANTYLQKFKLSKEAWELSHYILMDEIENNNVNNFDTKTRIFAAQTLRSKINFNLSQLPNGNLSSIKDSLLKLLLSYSIKKNMKVIRTQLNIALVSLCLQFLAWQDPISDIIQLFELESQKNFQFTNDYLSSLLEFIRILPEECNEVNKTSLTDEQYSRRIKVLINQKSKQKVLSLLIQLSSLNDKQINGNVLNALNSWVSEIPITEILSTESLYQLIFNNLLNDENFELSIETLISIIKETKDIENLDLISNLYSELIKLKELLLNNFETLEIVNGLSRLFVEIGESWNTQIMKNPEYFKDLIEIILKCCEYKEDLDIIKYTFNFWFMSAVLLGSPSFSSQKQTYVPVFTRLVEIILDQLKYPINEEVDPSIEQSTKELFDHDLESREKFVEFRYEIGDVLKECCSLIGADNCLSIPYSILSKIFNNCNASSAIHWQIIEAPLFLLRSMATEISSNSDNVMLNQIFELLINFLNSNSSLLNFQKIKYAIILVFGRYSRYTAFHPVLLKPQLDFIISNLTIILQQTERSETQTDVLSAASNSLMYFCQDCDSLLIPHLNEFHDFYLKIRDPSCNLDESSLYEIIDGFAHIIQSQPYEDAIVASAKMFIEPMLKDLTVFNDNHVEINNKNDDLIYKDIADKIEPLTIMFSVLIPKDPSSEINKVADLIMEIYPIIEELFNNFKQNFKVSERIVKFLKTQVNNQSTYLVPILPRIINLVEIGYKDTTFGCYLWITGIVIKEFNDDYVTDDIKQGVFNFGEKQGTLFLESLNLFFNDINIERLIMNNKNISEADLKILIDKLISIEDKMEDFFRMMSELLVYFPFQLVKQLLNANSLASQSFMIGLMGLHLDKYDTLISILRYLIDLVSWGNAVPPIRLYSHNPPEVRQVVFNFLFMSKDGSSPSNAAFLFNFCLRGLLFNFPNDVTYDAYDLINKLIKLSLEVSDNDSNITKQWIEYFVTGLPENSINDQEKFKFVSKMESSLNTKNMRKLKITIKEFVSYYIRKNSIES